MAFAHIGVLLVKQRWDGTLQLSKRQHFRSLMFFSKANFCKFNLRGKFFNKLSRVAVYSTKERVS